MASPGAAWAPKYAASSSTGSGAKLSVFIQAVLAGHSANASSSGTAKRHQRGRACHTQPINQAAPKAAKGAASWKG